MHDPAHTELTKLIGRIIEAAIGADLVLPLSGEKNSQKSADSREFTLEDTDINAIIKVIYAS